MSKLAKVERFRPVRLGHMVTKERAVLPCGCMIAVGVRIDNGEATTGAQPCSRQHTVLTERANQLIVESLAAPTKRLLVEVCRDLLTQAAKETG